MVYIKIFLHIPTFCVAAASLPVYKIFIVIDELLLNECKAGNRSAQRTVYDYLGPKLYSVCKRYIKQDTDAEDVLAEIFYIIFTKMAMLKETAAFIAWCRKIAVNQCLQALRKKVNFHLSIDGSGQVPQQHYATSGHQSEQNDLLQLITYLPDGCRTVFNLICY